MSEPSCYGLMATFHTAPQIYQAAGRVKDAGYSRWEAFTPFPVHGLEYAMGQKRSPLGVLALVGGIAGFLTGVGLVAFMNYDYPLIVGGKPIFGMIFPFPIFYELTILFAAFGAFFGMFVFNGLPRHHHPVFDCPGFEACSDDKFMILIESSDPLFDEEATRAYLESLGGDPVTFVPYVSSGKGGAR